ncbi:hypothetical protein GALL_513700 [mine drainage metagenome]|uniref:Uncharacterized protein n=1 Tax=mine drainage metagenome TaxID=410659 RepID=A0A1J5PGZ1_9ZZZZ
MSSIGMTSRPSMWPHLLGETWSSSWMPQTPAFSYSLTARFTLMALPKPVSPSASTGIFTASAISPARFSISLIVSKPTSGAPSTLAEAP